MWVKKVVVGFINTQTENLQVSSKLPTSVIKTSYIHQSFTDEEIVDRLILIMVNEAVRCLEEEVVGSPKDIDFGMIMGTG